VAIVGVTNLPTIFDVDDIITRFASSIHSAIGSIHFIRGNTMPRAIRGVLIQCDPSIKSIIVNIDSTNHDYIIEDLDEERVVVKETMVASLKQKLEDRLKENLPPVDESGSE